MRNQTMQQQVFVPLTDEMLYEHPECINGPLMPYNYSQPCHHELAATYPAKNTKYQSENGRASTLSSTFQFQSIRAQEIA